MMRLFMFLLIVVLLPLASPVVAAELRCRVTGLFQPDRVDDLNRLVTTLADEPAGPLAGVQLQAIDYRTATVTFRYNADAPPYVNRSPQQVREHLDRALRGRSRQSFKLFPLDEHPPPLQQETIAVAGLDCKGCAYATYKSIELLAGVDRATVDFAAGRVVAWIDPQQTDRETLITALSGAGVAFPSAESP